MNFKMPQLIHYVRDKNWQKVGCVVAFKDENGIPIIGWSRLNCKKDRFNREVGLKIAIGRAEKLRFGINSSLFDIKNEDTLNDALVIEDDILYMQDRSARYFKAQSPLG